MATLLGISPGACRRGGGRKVFGDLPPIVVSPESLRPGEDLVRVRAEATASPVAPGTWCLYLGHYEGLAIVLPQGTDEPVPVSPWHLDEPEALPCDDLDPYEFLDGWAFGRSACVREVAASDSVKGSVPDAWSRGFAQGYDDQLAKRGYRPGSWAPYNDVVRKLALSYPDEHFALTLRRLRTFRAAVAA